jgi:class 3 adenylate cyclase
VAATPAEEVAQGERRQLTVMFCDLVGSTALGQRLDPEDLRDVLAAYHDACSAAVKRFEGHVAQYLGDGVLVYFGFPVAHEDDADRAVRTALAIQSSLAVMNGERGKLGVPEIAARIGIHTGPVVMSEMGDQARQPMALGDTINVASRLEAVAEPGHVVISHTTLALVPGLFVTREIGTPDLKGVSAPIVVHVVEGAAGVSRGLHAAQSSTPLASRTAGSRSRRVAGRSSPSRARPASGSRGWSWRFASSSGARPTPGSRSAAPPTPRAAPSSP